MQPTSHAPNRPVLRTLGILVGALFLGIGPLIPIAESGYSPGDLFGVIIYLAMGATFVRYGIMGHMMVTISSHPASFWLTASLALGLATVALYSALAEVPAGELRSVLQGMGICFGVCIALISLRQRHRHTRASPRDHVGTD